MRWIAYGMGVTDDGRMVEFETPGAPRECAWCGCCELETDTGCTNRRDEWFCCKSHRDASNRALRRITG